MTALDLIAEKVATDASFEIGDARELLTAMQDYREKYFRTYQSLKRIPGFAKLWDAIEEAAEISAVE